MELSQVILQHILNTVLTILAGFFIGGGLGVLFAWLFRQLYRAVPGLRPVLMLLPGRTLLFALVLFFSSPMAFIAVPSVPQELISAFFPALAFALIVFFIVADGALTHWLPAGLAVRLTGLARTLTIACGVIVAIGANETGSGILNYARIMYGSTFSPNGFWTALGVVTGLGLVFDLLLGTVQMLLAVAEGRKAATQTASTQGD